MGYKPPTTCRSCRITRAVGSWMLGLRERARRRRGVCGSWGALLGISTRKFNNAGLGLPTGASVSVPSLRRATRAFGKQDLRTQEIERSLDDDIRGSDLYSVRENYMLMMAVAVAKTVREGGSLRVGKLWDPEGRSRKGGAQRFSCGMILSLGMAMTGRGLCSRACSPERMASVDTMPAMWIGTRRSGWTLREGA